MKILKVLRLLRVLRPLRVIGKNEGLKLAVQTLIKAIPNLLNLIVVLLIFYLLFAIFCVSFMKGRFYHCSITKDTGVIETKFDCLNYGGIWVNKLKNFDNVLNGMMTLFEISTASWVETMWDCVDQRGIDLEPKKYYNLAWVLFVIALVVFFMFFLINLFVGVVVTTFNQEKERLGKDFLLTNNQKEWLNVKMLCLNTRPLVLVIPKGTSLVQHWCLRIATSKSFDFAILACIMLNTLLLSMKWIDQHPLWENVITAFNLAFAIIFTLEAIIKIAGMKKHYFRDNWNKFDFFIVIATIVGLLMERVANFNIGGQAALVRAFRVLRVFRLIQRAKVLKIIIDTFIATLPSIANVGGLLILILFIFSVLGMQLYGRIKF